MKIIDLYLVAEFYSAFEEGPFLRTAKRYLTYISSSIMYFQGLNTK